MADKFERNTQQWVHVQPEITLPPLEKLHAAALDEHLAFSGFQDRVRQLREVERVRGTDGVISVAFGEAVVVAPIDQPPNTIEGLA